MLSLTTRWDLASGNCEVDTGSRLDKISIQLRRHRPLYSACMSRAAAQETNEQGEPAPHLHPLCASLQRSTRDQLVLEQRLRSCMSQKPLV
jgi:hypothetical protein